jgi:hypothetical protein
MVKVLLNDADGDVTSEPMACNVIAIGHHHVGTLAIVEVEPDAVSSLHADEVMGGPYVE